MINNDWWKETFSKTYFSLWDHEKSSSPDKKKGKNNGLNFLSALKLKEKSEILDLACGSGRHSVELAQKDFKVTGVDYSKSALDIAKKLAKSKKVQVSFLKDDIRFFNFKKEFDAVFLLGNSFGYFSDKDNERVIKKASKHLKQGGYFVIHTVNPLQVLAWDKQNSAYEYNIPDGKLKMKIISFDPATFVRKSIWEINRKNENKKLAVAMRLYTMPEFNSMFVKNNFKNLKIFGSLDLKPYTTESPALLIIGRKI